MWRATCPSLRLASTFQHCQLCGHNRRPQPLVVAPSDWLPPSLFCYLCCPNRPCPPRCLLHRPADWSPILHSDGGKGRSGLHRMWGSLYDPPAAAMCLPGTLLPPPLLPVPVSLSVPLPPCWSPAGVHVEYPATTAQPSPVGLAAPPAQSHTPPESPFATPLRFGLHTPAAGTAVGAI